MKHNYLKHLFTALLLLCTTVVTAHDFEVGGIYYKILSEEAKTVEVTFKGTSYYDSEEYSGSVVIPKSVTNNSTTYSVTSIGMDAFGGCTGLTSITIPKSVTNIREYAFYSCHKLTSVEIPNSVTSIGEYAFDECTALKSITIPNSVTSIGPGVFFYCTSLTNITIPNSVTSIENYAFTSCSGLTSVVIGNSVTSIGMAAFSGCSKLTSVVIGNSVTSIGNSAFEGCTALKSITIPSSVTSIGGYAFYNCSGLTSVTSFATKAPALGFQTFIGISSMAVLEYSAGSDYSVWSSCFASTKELAGSCGANVNWTLGDGVLTISGNGAMDDYHYWGAPWYKYRNEITMVIIEEGVTSIGDYAFESCTGLTRVVIPNSVTSIGEYAFYECNAIKKLELNCAIIDSWFKEFSSIQEVVLGNCVTSIGSSAFEDCTGLKSVIISNSVTSIGNYAFYNCSRLTSIEIPNSVTTIGDGAFVYCSRLTSIEIPNSVTSIGGSAFSVCSGLKNVTIGNSVTSIGSSAFYNCKGLTSIEIPNSVTNIGSSAFRNCTGLTSIEIPYSVTSIGNDAFYYCTGLTSVEIPNSVTTIGDSTFYDCSALTSVEIPNSVTSIGNSAFTGCSGLKEVHISDLTAWCGIDFSNSYSNPLHYAGNLYLNGELLTELVIPDSVKEIKKYAFEDCTGLISVVIGNSVTSIGYEAFDGCSGLISVVIGNSVTSIGHQAFRNCSGLKNVTIGNSVTSIGGYAFYNCSKLNKVYNNSSINVKAGSTDNGYVAYYANAVIEKNDDIQGDYVFRTISGIPTLIIYIGNDTEITLPDSYNGNNYAIGEKAFMGLSIASVTIPNSVTSIGTSAFYSCKNLKTVINFSNITFSKGSGSNGYIAYYANKVFNAPNGFIDGDFVWFENESGITLAGYLGDSTELTLPTEYNGKSVTSIGEYAFYGCTSLTSIEIPNSVTSIGEYAFYNCKGLTSIVIPNSVTSIPNYAFYGCTGLTSITIPNSVTSIGNYAFYGCTGLTSITIPNSVTSIGNYAFYGCTGLTSITIPNSVTSIGNYAFYYCTGLTSIDIPNSVTSIGEYAFYNCKGLTSVVIGNSVTSIGAKAFYDCTGLTSITIPNSVTSIGNSAFYNCTGLTSITIPNSVTSIGYYAFEYCTGLTSVEIGNSVTSIGSSAFYGCSALKTVINDSDLDIEKGSTSNGYVAYYADEVILIEFKFELVDGVYTLVKYRGKGVKQEETTTFDSWTSTNKGQGGSTSSYKYTFDATVGSKLSFDWSVSSEEDYDKLYVILDGTIELTRSGVYSGSYKHTFTADGSHTLEVEYTKDGGVDENNDEAKIYNVKLAKTLYKLVDVVLPDNYEGESYVIGESAFENNEYVACVTIPEGVEMICDKAFSGCSNLENIVIPNSVLAIGGDAFAGTKWYDNQEDGMVYAGNVLYKYKGSMPENTAITINDGILGIAGSAFANCTGLTSITSLIPADNLFVPGSDAFVGVDKTNCTLYVPYGAKETYASTAGWNEFVNIVELEKPITEVTVIIGQYGCATYCSPYALDFSEVDGLKAYAATGYKSNSQVVTLTRVQTSEPGIGLFLKGEPGEYVVPVIESTDEHSLNMLVGTLEETVVNNTDGAMSNYKFTIADGDTAPMFYPFEDNTTFSAGKAYLQIPTAWLPVTAQKSLNIRFDEGETTDIDELEGENGKVKTVYDLQGRVVENPTNGIYIIDGKKVLVK